MWEEFIYDGINNVHFLATEYVRIGTIFYVIISGIIPVRVKMK